MRHRFGSNDNLDEYQRKMREYFAPSVPDIDLGEPKI
jgi:hypothetical protein